MSSSTFSWLQSSESQERSNPGRRRIQAPASVDTSELMAANEDLLIGLFEGTYPGLKLASALVYPIISIPVQFLGSPTPTSKNDATKKLLAEKVIPDCIGPLDKLYTRHAVVGVAWGWPNWDAKNRRIFHEIIPDKSIVAIIKNQDTNEIVMIITDEMLTIQIGENQTGNVRRKRFFTEQSVRVEYEGNTNGMLVSKVSRNPSGIMPVPFSCSSIDNRTRSPGYLQRLLPDLKDYHDTDLKWGEMLTKFNIKMVQDVSSDPSAWAGNNAQLGTLEEMDVSSSDLIFNLKDKESTEFVFPENSAFASFRDRLELKFWKIIQGSPIAESQTGLMATGNHASVEADGSNLMRFIDGEHNRLSAPTLTYIKACVRLESGASMQSVDPDISMEWNDLDIMSAETRAKVLTGFADAVAKLYGNAPMEMLHALLMTNYPKATPAEFSKFMDQMRSAAKMKQFATASYEDAIDTEGPVMAGENSL